MKLDFDTYEFAGLVAPGSVVVFAALLVDPRLVAGLESPIVILGAVVAAYIMGHLVAAIGNLCEGLFALLGIARLERVPFAEWAKKRYISGDQTQRFREVAGARLHGNVDKPDELFRLVKQMRLVLLEKSSEACTQRLETFNGLYNLSRGLAVAFAIAVVLCAISALWGLAVFCAVAVVLACYRVWKFNDIYARELIQQFLLLDG